MIYDNSSGAKPLTPTQKRLMITPESEFKKALEYLNNNPTDTKYTSDNGISFLFIPDPDNPGNKLPIARIMVLGRGGFAKTELYASENKLFAVKKSKKSPDQLSRDISLLPKAPSIYDSGKSQLISAFTRVTKKKALRAIAVMEAMPGIEMTPVLHTANGANPLPLAVHYQIALNLIDALQKLHDNNIIHCDLKPDNIIFDPTTLMVYIIDLGLAIDVSNAPNKTVIIRGARGTDGYIAPEIKPSKKNEFSFKTDVYSLGVIFKALQLNTSITNRMLCGIYSRASLKEIRDLVDAQLPSLTEDDKAKALYAAPLNCITHELNSVSTALAAIAKIFGNIKITNYSQDVLMLTHEQEAFNAEINLLMHSINAINNKISVIAENATQGDLKAREEVQLLLNQSVKLLNSMDAILDKYKKYNSQHQTIFDDIKFSHLYKMKEVILRSIDDYFPEALTISTPTTAGILETTWDSYAKFAALYELALSITASLNQDNTSLAMEQMKNSNIAIFNQLKNAMVSQNTPEKALSLPQTLSQTKLAIDNFETALNSTNNLQLQQLFKSAKLDFLASARIISPDIISDPEITAMRTASQQLKVAEQERLQLAEQLFTTYDNFNTCFNIAQEGEEFFTKSSSPITHPHELYFSEELSLAFAKLNAQQKIIEQNFKALVYNLNDKPKESLTQSIQAAFIESSLILQSLKAPIKKAIDTISTDRKIDFLNNFLISIEAFSNQIQHPSSDIESNDVLDKIGPVYKTFYNLTQKLNILHITYPHLTELTQLKPYLEQLQNAITAYIIAKDKNVAKAAIEDVLKNIAITSQQLLDTVPNFTQCKQYREELHKQIQQNFPSVIAKIEEEQNANAKLQQELSEYFNVFHKEPTIGLKEELHDEFDEAMDELQNNPTLTKYTTKNGTKFIFVIDPSDQNNKIPMAFVMTLGESNTARTERYANADGTTLEIKKSLHDPLQLKQDEYMLNKRPSMMEPGQPILVSSYLQQKNDGSTQKVLIMEDIPGMAMHAALMPSGNLDYLSDTAKYNLALKLIAALQDLHNNGIVHCDVKAENIRIYLDSNGELQVNLVELDKAQEFDKKQGFTVGSEYYLPPTPPHVAPELRHVKPIYSPKADVYSLGYLLQHVLSLAPSITQGLCKANLNERSSLDEAQANILNHMQANNINKIISLDEKLQIKYLTSVNFICSNMQVCLNHIVTANKFYANLNALNDEQRTMYDNLTTSAAKLEATIEAINNNLNIVMTNNDDMLKQQARDIILQQIELASMELDVLNKQIILYNNMLKQNNLPQTECDPKFNKLMKSLTTFSNILEEHKKAMQVAKKSSNPELFLSYNKFKHATQHQVAQEAEQLSSHDNKSSDPKPK